MSTDRLRRIDDAMQRLVDTGKLAGTVTLVARRRHVAHFGVAGMLDREADRPMRRDAIFRIASMTKPFTCVAALMLFEEGRFLLDDAVAEFLPEFADTKVLVGGAEIADLKLPISVRHLMMHTSGIGYDFTAVPEVAAMYKHEAIAVRDEPLSEMVRRLAAIPLSHQPGERWTYGLSHDVLARLVEVVSGQPFDVFLRERIFDPLRMPDTGHHHSPNDIDRVAAVYESLEGGGIERVDRPDLDFSKPRMRRGGGSMMVSTAADYGRFCQTLLNGGVLDGERILGRKTVDLMATNQTGPTSPLPAAWPADWSVRAYGFGLGVRVLMDVSKSNSGGSLGEYGWWGGLSTTFWIDPSEEMYGVFLAQLEPAQFRYGRLLQALAYQALVDK